MTLSKVPCFFALIFLVLSFCACSNPQADYEKVQKLISATEQTYKQTADYDIRIKCCDDVIVALQSFLANHRDGEWANVATNSLAAWQSKKLALQEELKFLVSEMTKQLATKAIEMGRKQHNMSNVEKIELLNHVASKSNLNINVKEDYAVRMRGALFGTSIFKLVVHTSGHIAMDTKAIVVDDSAPVEE